jgi:hypothetical protein
MLTTISRYISLAALISIVVVSCKPKIQEVDPPFANIESAWYTDHFDAGEEKEVIFENGTRLRIPADAFVDQEGNAVSGRVSLKFREISSVDEILISGIPMTVSNDYQKVMTSADMFEIRAYKEGQELELANGKSIETTLASNVGGSDYDLYSFDTKEGKWLTKTQIEPIENPAKAEALQTMERSDSLLQTLSVEGCFAFNYIDVLDVWGEMPDDGVFNYFQAFSGPSERDIEEMIKARLSSYNADFASYPIYEQIAYNGQSYHAGMVLWEPSTELPDWFYSYGNTRYGAFPVFVSKGKNKYRIYLKEWRYKDGDYKKVTLLAFDATIRMPLRELYSATPAQYSEKYEELMASIEESKARYEAQNMFLRTFAIDEMGIYNYDKLISGDRLMASVNLIIDGQEFEWTDGTKLLAIPRESNSVITYDQYSKDKFVVFEGQDMVVFMVTQDQKVAILANDFFQKMDFDRLQQKEEIVLNMNLKTLDKKMEDAEDVREFLVSQLAPDATKDLAMR